MRKEMHVLMITPRFWPAIGGVEKHVQEISVALLNRNIRCDVITHSHRHDLRKQEKHNGICIFRVPQGWQRFPFLLLLWLIRTKRDLNRYHVIHVHDAVPLVEWYLVLKLLFPHTRIYCTFHGFERDPIPSYFRVLRKVAARLVSGTICIGTFIEKYYGIECGLISHGGTHCSEIVSKGGEGAVFVGRLEADTGVLQYFEALKILKAQFGVDVQLTVCGEGSLRASLENISRRNGLGVRFLGTVDDPKLTLATHRYCFSSSYLSILEAMSLGLPVLSVASSPLKQEYLKSLREQGAPLSIQSTPLGLAEEIMKLIRDKTLEDTVSERSIEFAKKMTWDAVAAKYRELWKRKNLVPLSN